MGASSATLLRKAVEQFQQDNGQFRILNSKLIPFKKADWEDDQLVETAQILLEAETDRLYMSIESISSVDVIGAKVFQIRAENSVVVILAAKNLNAVFDDVKQIASKPKRNVPEVALFNAVNAIEDKLLNCIEGAAESPIFFRCSSLGLDLCDVAVKTLYRRLLRAKIDVEIAPIQDAEGNDVFDFIIYVR